MNDACQNPPRIIRLLRDTAIIASVTIGLLLVVELTIRWIAPQESRSEYRETGSIGVPDDRLGHVYRPGAVSMVHGPEFSAEYRINAEGMRDETPHPAPKRPESTRILVVGDSFAFGAGNEYEKIWPVLLERTLRMRGHQVDVVKAGVSAYDTAKEALYLERLFPRYEPDVVLLAFLPNDLFTNRPIEETGSASPGEQEDRVVLAQEERPLQLHTVMLAKRLLISIDFLYAKLYLATPRGQYFSSPTGERLAGQLTVSRDLLARIKRYCDARSAAFVVLSIPQQFQVIALANEYRFDGIDPGLLDELFLQFAAEDGYAWVPTLDALARAYPRDDAGLYFRLDGHLNNAGNEIVADVASRELERILAAPPGGKTDPPPREPVR